MSKYHPQNCSNCKSENLYSNVVTAGGSGGPFLLPKLGSFGKYASMYVFVCENCGYIQFFADKEACSKLETKWTKVSQ